jgi:hypothetical protein
MLHSRGEEQGGMGDGNQARAGRPTFSVDGVHLLRTAAQTQYQLSQMADQKASMLLGITFVIFTISVGQAKFGQPQPALVILGAAAFVAAFLTILAVLPSVKPGPKPDSIRNILFFGSFTQLPEDEYVARLLEIVGDSQTVYEAFAHDIYQNGTVLAVKKYKLIGYAYRVMLVGLSLSFLTFIAPPALKLVGL